MILTKPAEIERESMKRIDRELAARGIILPEDTAPVVRRVIHATADFDFAESLCFTPESVRLGTEALRGGMIVTDTNMALVGLNRGALRALGTEACCYMAEEAVARQAREQGMTRAAVSVDLAVTQFPHAVFAVGNAPTALLRLAEHMEAGVRPALIIGVPVGFVNVVESKERLLEVCARVGVPAIVACGRKGGSSISVAICNALLYRAAGTLDPETRI